MYPVIKTLNSGRWEDALIVTGYMRNIVNKVENSLFNQLTTTPNKHLLVG